MQKHLVRHTLTMAGICFFLAGEAHTQPSRFEPGIRSTGEREVRKVLETREADPQLAPEKKESTTKPRLPVKTSPPLQREQTAPSLETGPSVRPQPVPRTKPDEWNAPAPITRPEAPVLDRQPAFGLPADTGSAPPSRFGFDPAGMRTEQNTPAGRPEGQRPGVARPGTHHDRPPQQVLDHPAGSRFPRDPHNVPGGYPMDSLPSRSPAAGGPMPDRERDMPHREGPHRGMGPAGAAKDPPSGSVFGAGTGPGAVSSGSSSGYVRSLFRGLGGTGGDQQAATPGELPGAIGRDTAGGLQTAQDASAFFGVLGMFFDSAAVVEIVADLIAAELEKQLEEESESGDEDQQTGSAPRTDDGWVGGGESAPTPRWDPTGRFGAPNAATPQDDGRLGGDGEGGTVLEINVTQEAADLEERRGRYRESGPQMTVPLDRFEQVTDPPKPDR